jgi:small subunit ribosomal protein S1
MIAKNKIADLVKTGEMLDPQLFSSAGMQTLNLNVDEIKEGSIVDGKILRRTRGGLIVNIGNSEAFLPGSQVDIRPVVDFDQYIDQKMEFEVVKYDLFRQNIIVSRKTILEESTKEKRETLFSEIEVGAVLNGYVKNIVDFGAFIDLNGIDGLLHITDISWGRIKHPSEKLTTGQTISVKVIDLDTDKKRVSLGLKQLSPHPWEGVDTKYPVDSIVTGLVVSLTNYGIFIEIEPGVEGLIHVSEMSWARQVKNPSEVYAKGEDIEARVIAIDLEKKKISLGVKQLSPDPWEEIQDKYEVGAVYKGTVTNLVQFGAFIELYTGVEGLIHVSDLSWTKVKTLPKEMFEIGQEVEVRVLEISVEDRRISLGFKQMQDDPWPEIMGYFEIGKEVSGVIERVIDKGVILNLEMNTEGLIPFLEIPKKKRKELKAELKPNEKLSGLVTAVNLEDRKIILFNEEINQ